MKNKFYKNTLILTAIAFGFVLIPAVLIQIKAIFFDCPIGIDSYWAQVITLAGVNAIMALSVNVVCGITGQLSLGQAGFQAIGAYAVILLTTNAHVPLPISIVLAGIISAIFGFLIGFPTLKLEGDYLAIVTLAFGEIIRVVLLNQKSWTGGPNGIQFSTVFTTSLDWGATIAFASVIGTLVLLIVALQNFLRSTYGRAIMSVREDEIAANSNGISVFRYKMIGFVKPDLASFNNSVNHLIYVVLGGMGSVTGSIISAFVLTVLQEFLRFLRDYRLLIYPLILICMMLFRPQGLLGTNELCFFKIPDYFKSIGRWFSKKFGKKSEKN